MIIVSFIFLNLFIAIILESFNTSQAEADLIIGQETIGKFNDFWENDKFDPKGKGYIHVDRFPELIEMIMDEEIRMRL